jgi:hypothetical protein
LGITYGKEVGKNVVLHRNSRNYNIDNNVGHYKNARNPITGRGGPISDMAIAIEVFQIAYVIITAIIIAREGRGHIREKTKIKG